MTIAIDTNVLMRLPVRDDEAQYAAAQRWVDEAAAAEEPVLIVIGALLLTARAAHLGRSRFLTFDAGAARLPGSELFA